MAYLSKTIASKLAKKVSVARLFPTTTLFNFIDLFL